MFPGFDYRRPEREEEKNAKLEASWLDFFYVPIHRRGRISTCKVRILI